MEEKDKIIKKYVKTSELFSKTTQNKDPEVPSKPEKARRGRSFLHSL